MFTEASAQIHFSSGPPADVILAPPSFGFVLRHSMAHLIPEGKQRGKSHPTVTMTHCKMASGLYALCPGRVHFLQRVPQSLEPLWVLHNSCNPQVPLFGHWHNCPDAEYENVTQFAQGHTAGQWRSRWQGTIGELCLPSDWLANWQWERQCAQFGLLLGFRGNPSLERHFCSLPFPLSNDTPRGSSPSESWARRHLKETAPRLSSCCMQLQFLSSVLSNSPGYTWVLRMRDTPRSRNRDFKKKKTQTRIMTTNNLWELLFIRLSLWEKVPMSRDQKALTTGDQGMVSGLQQRKARRHPQGSERPHRQAAALTYLNSTLAS